jgi:hypothetical protein
MAGELVRFNEERAPAHAPRRTYDEIERMATAIARSRLFGVTQVEQVIALMLMAEAEGRHVASAMQDYTVINGRPSLKAEAMLARFQNAGGKVRWTCLTDDRVAAIFAHPSCDPIEIDWDMTRARQAGIGGNQMWKKYPRQMLRARVISEGVRTVYPGALGGVYATEEVADFSPSTARDAAPYVPNGNLAAPEEPGEVEALSEPPPSFHDRQSNVPGGFKTLKDIPVDEEQIVDHTQDPLWAEMSMELHSECQTKADVTAWWDARKKELRQRKPHFAKAFFQGVVIPLAAALNEQTVWEEEL